MRLEIEILTRRNTYDPLDLRLLGENYFQKYNKNIMAKNIIWKLRFSIIKLKKAKRKDMLVISVGDLQLGLRLQKIQDKGQYQFCFSLGGGCGACILVCHYFSTPFFVCM